MLLKRFASFFQVIVKEKAGLETAHTVSDRSQAVKAALAWLCAAQDVTIDQGVSAYYTMLHGWAPSFIETTGYIIGTLLRAETMVATTNLNFRKRALAMADFLVAMQLPNGGFRAYPPQVKELTEPIIFNTGQDLLGMCDVYHVEPQQKYYTSIVAAANYLVKTQENDGTWLQPPHDPHPHTYHSRVAWALVKAWNITKNHDYKTAAERTLDWVVAQQHPNGWFTHAELPGFPALDPITHTIAYTVEGLFYSGLLLKNHRYLTAALQTLTHVAQLYLTVPLLAATYTDKWHPTASYTCLTGDAQFGQLWWLAYAHTHQPLFYKAANKITTFLQTTQSLNHPDRGIRGGIAGSYPLEGDMLTGRGYCRLAYLNWATKFYADCVMSALAINHQQQTLLTKATYVFS